MAAPCAEKGVGREQAVAEIGFGYRTQADHGAAARKAGGLGSGHVRRVDQAPALRKRDMVEQPFHRTRAGP